MKVTAFRLHILLLKILRVTGAPLKKKKKIEQSVYNYQGWMQIKNQNDQDIIS